MVVVAAAAAAAIVDVGALDICEIKRKIFVFLAPDEMSLLQGEGEKALSTFKVTVNHFEGQSQLFPRALSSQYSYAMAKLWHVDRHITDLSNHTPFQAKFI